MSGLVGGRPSLIFNDAIANLDSNKAELLFQEAIEKLDSRQDQTELINNYYAQPVIACVDVLPGTGVDGDRYLLKSDPPVIKVWEDTGFIDQQFPVGAQVTDGILSFIRSNQGVETLNRQVTRDREPDFCDNLPLGIEWQYQEKIYKSVAKQNFGTVNQTIGIVIVQAPTVVDNISLNVEQWQSFTPSVDGTINMFRISGFFATSGAEFTLKFYEGEGVNGNLVYEEIFSINAPPNQAAPTFTLDCPVIVNVGIKYTYSIQQTPGSINFVTYVYKNTVTETTRNYLPNEISSQGDRDLLNQIFIEPGQGTTWKDISEVGGQNISAKLTNAQMTNLNSTFAGNMFVFDPGSLETDGNFTATADGIVIEEGAEGVYKAELTHYGTVPGNGAQRTAVSIRLLINGIQNDFIGTSYIRRASGTNENSTYTSDRLILNVGDTIGALGFRNGNSGIVTSPAGLSKLLLIKIA